MKAILDHLPPFWIKALEAPATWSFWEWVAYGAAVIAILTFVRAVLRQLVRLSNRFLLPQFSKWAVRINLWTIHANTDELYHNVTEVWRWRNDPLRMTAFIVRSTAQSMAYLTLGLLAALTLPSPFTLILTAPLFGLALLNFSFLRSKMILIFDLQKYVARKVNTIERDLTKVENFFDDDADILKRLDPIRSHLAEINEFAERINEYGDDTQPDSDATSESR